MKIFFSLLILVALCSSAVAQQRNGFDVASQRADKAALVLKQFAALGADSVPFEVFRRSKGVAVFSNITQFNMLINKFGKGKGVLSLRQEGGWSAPIFLDFSSISYELKIAGKKNFDVICFIMDDNAVNLLKKGGIKPQKIAGDRFALGPVVGGRGAELVLQKASIIYYTLQNGELSGLEFPNDAVFSGVGIKFDNSLNKAVYKNKGQIVLAQNKNDLLVPPAIDNFRLALSESLAPAK